MFGFYEFFAGGGMARSGLGAGWNCFFSNDFDPKKVKAYTANWGSNEISLHDIRALKTESFPGYPDLVWASFPCQDLSVAGSGAGLDGDRSGMFWPFWTHMRDLAAHGRAPKIIALENVYGTITSHEGKDFRAIANAFARLGYRFGAVVVDARLFVPQSRPRLFIVGVCEDLEIPRHLTGSKPSTDLWHPPKLIDAYASLNSEVKGKWIWWQFPEPAKGNITFSDVVDENPISVRWHTSEETARLLAMMSPTNFAKVAAAKKLKRRLVGGVYKRTRHDASGKKVQRAEVRFDGVSGCLRTPAGGSSRQTILVIEGEKLRSRLLAPREAARLMGLPEDYKLPENYNEAYHLVGDGVAVPVVRHLAQNLFEPILRSKRTIRRAA